jgi:hypothetical protein
VSGDAPFRDSLCHQCANLRLVTTHRGSVFLMCLDPTLPKYPPQPVRACPRFTAVAG